MFWVLSQSVFSLPRCSARPSVYRRLYQVTELGIVTRATHSHVSCLTLALAVYCTLAQNQSISLCLFVSDSQSPSRPLCPSPLLPSLRYGWTICRVQKIMSSVFSIARNLTFCEGFSQRTWSSLISLGWLAMGLQGFSCVCLLVAGVKGVPTVDLLRWCWRPNSGPLYAVSALPIVFEEAEVGYASLPDSGIYLLSTEL